MYPTPTPGPSPAASPSPSRGVYPHVCLQGALLVSEFVASVSNRVFVCLHAGLGIGVVVAIIASCLVFAGFLIVYFRKRFKNVPTEGNGYISLASVSSDPGSQRVSPGRPPMTLRVAPWYETCMGKLFSVLIWLQLCIPLPCSVSCPCCCACRPAPEVEDGLLVSNAAALRVRPSGPLAVVATL